MKLLKTIPGLEKFCNAIWGGGTTEVVHVQDVGTKLFGKIYIDKISKKAYRCIANPSTTSTDLTASNFEACNVVDNLDKLQNLFYYDSGSRAVIKKGSHGIIEEKHKIVFSGNHTVGQTYKVVPLLIKDIVMIDYSILDEVFDRFFTNHIEASSTLGGIAFKRIVGGSTLSATITFIGR